MPKFLFAFLLYLLLAPQPRAAAQCTLTPADCPEATDYGSPDDSTNRMGNPLLPMEITLENRLRQWSNDLIDQIATREHWTYIELNETYSSGFRAADNSVLAYPLRPPHWLVIRYQLIVSEDSLAAWRSWLGTFSQRRLDATLAYAKQQVGQTNAAKANEDFENERRRQTIHYREAATLVVEFEFNTEYVNIAGAPANPPSSAPASPATTILWFNNPNPEFNSIDLFDRTHNNVIVLAGAWSRSPDGHAYRPAWKNSKTATDLSTPKQFPSDRVQTLDCRLSGNLAAMSTLLADLQKSAIHPIVPLPHFFSL